MLKNNTAIGFDARPLFRKRDGIGTYVEQTMLAAAKLYPNTQFIGVIFKGDDVVDCSIKQLPKNIIILKLPFRWRYYRALAETGVWAPIDKYFNTQLDAFIYFNYTALPWVSKKVPKKLLVHDATYLLYPNTVSKKNLTYLKKFVKKSINKPNVKSYTLSHHSAKILKSKLKKDFIVASPGASPLQSTIRNKKSDGSFLFIGTLEPRKNLINLVQAYSLLDELYQKEHPLVIAGREGWGNTKIDHAIKSNKNIKRVVSPSDTELAQLYASASCYVMPSIYEGFGIPVLDAARFNIPVITSKDSSMQEILGTNGAIYVDPNNIESIKDGLNNFANADGKTLTQMVKNSQQNVNSYTWDNTATLLFSEFIHS